MLMQLAASGLGGRLAGRLKAKWAAVRVDEVHFLDTGHGFVAWAVTSLVSAAIPGLVCAEDPLLLTRKEMAA